MIGPEAVMAASTASTGSGAGVGAECGGDAEAALVTAGVAGFVSPQPTATRTATNTIGPIKLRILFPRPLYQPNQNHIFSYTQINGRRKRTKPSGSQPTRTFPRPSIPTRMAPSELGIPTRA